MKKLFTLVALLALCLGAQAGSIVDHVIDYSTWTEWNQYKMGYKPQIVDGVLWSNPSVHNWDGDADDYSSETANWYQFFMASAFQGEEDTKYDVTFTIKGSAAGTFNANLRWSWGADPVNADGSFTEEWQDVTLSYDEVGGSNIDIIFQSSFQGDIYIAKVVVSHDPVESTTPEVWNELLVNGNAEGEYGDVPCAYAKEFDRYQNEDGMPENEPYPCDIEDDGTGNKVFVVHAKQVNKDDFAEGGQYYAYPGNNDANAHAWMNQFWIQSPHAWKKGEQVTISFRYKASKAVSADTQCHLEKPGQYKHWSAIGSVNFTEEWQTYGPKKWTIPDDGDGMWSIAFNLKEVDTDVTYYFDDLSWQEQEFEEGYFIAGANAKEGLPYDYEKSITMKWDEDIELYVATVGTEEDPVHEIKVSTKRGTDKAFQANTLKLKEAARVSDVDDPDELDWIDWEYQSKSEIKLPGTGVWKVYLDRPTVEDGYQAMGFYMVSGKLDEKVDVKPNPTEIVVEGQERNIFKPEDAEGDVDENGQAWGQAWDNQFWIMANHTLAAGEETHLSFKYKASTEAKTTTQCHKGAGEYLHWAAIGDVTFTTEWQDFDADFVVPSSADGMQSIAFNMAEIQEACTYQIKDVVWKYTDDSESLINMTGAKNFWVKVGAGTAPYNYEDGPSTPDVTPGDINGDNTLNVNDVVALVSVVLGEKELDASIADVNGDGEVNINDVVKLVSLILDEE